MDIAEEIFKSTITDEWIAFQIEKDVALSWRGSRQARNPRHRQKFM